MKILVVLSRVEDLRPAFLREIAKHSGHFGIVQMNAANALAEIKKAPREIAVFVIGPKTYRELGTELAELGVNTIVVSPEDTAVKGDATVVTRRKFPQTLQQALEKYK